MPLGKVSVKEQPDLEKVLNTMVDAINAISEPVIRAGRGVRVVRQGHIYIVEAAPEKDYYFAGLYPRALKKELESSVGLTPGYVTFPRKGTTSVSVPPYIGEDAETGTPINAPDPPSKVLLAGTYYTRLKLEEANTAKVDFVLTSEDPDTDADYLVINKFKVSLLYDGDIAITDVEIYQSEPMAQAAGPDSSKWFGLTNTTDPDETVGGEGADAFDPVYRVQVRGGYVYAPELYGTPVSMPPSVTSLLQSYDVDAMVDLIVDDGYSVYVKIPIVTTKTYSEDTNGIGHKTVVYTFDPATIIEAEAHPTDLPPPSTATYSYILLADISIDSEGVMTIEQRHDGAITVPCVTLPYLEYANVGSGPEYWLTQAIDSTTVSIKRGLLLGSYWQVSADPSAARATQMFQYLWHQSDGLLVAEDIEITGLADGDYLWVEVVLEHQMTTTETDVIDTHYHHVRSQYAVLPPMVWNIIAHGPSYEGASPGTFRFPFAQMVSGQVHQLHLGIIHCPQLTKVLDYVIPLGG